MPIIFVITFCIFENAIVQVKDSLPCVHNQIIRCHLRQENIILNHIGGHIHTQTLCYLILEPFIELDFSWMKSLFYGKALNGLKDIKSETNRDSG